MRNKMLLFAGMAFAVVVLLGGCEDKKAREDLAQLRAELRDYKFVRPEPKLTVTILKREVLAAETEFGVHKVRITGVVKQTAPFPVEKYHVVVSFLVEANGHEANARGDADIQDGSGAFTADAWFTRSTMSVPPGESSLKISISELGWYQPPEWQSHVVFEDRSKK